MQVSSPHVTRRRYTQLYDSTSCARDTTLPLQKYWRVTLSPPVAPIHRPAIDACMQSPPAPTGRVNKERDQMPNGGRTHPFSLFKRIPYHVSSVIPVSRATSFNCRKECCDMPTSLQGARPAGRFLQGRRGWGEGARPRNNNDYFPWRPCLGPVGRRPHHRDYTVGKIPTVVSVSPHQ